MQVDVREEQRLTVERHAVRYADVSDVSSGTRGADGLRHRLLRADALEHGIRANALCQLLDALDTSIAALGDDIGRAKLARERLPRLMAAHGDDPLGPHVLG